MLEDEGQKKTEKNEKKEKKEKMARALQVMLYGQPLGGKEGSLKEGRWRPGFANKCLNRNDSET